MKFKAQGAQGGSLWIGGAFGVSRFRACSGRITRLLPGAQGAVISPIPID